MSEALVSSVIFTQAEAMMNISDDVFFLRRGVLREAKNRPQTLTLSRSCVSSDIVLVAMVYDANGNQTTIN